MSKAKGSRNERKCIKILEAAGYICTKAGGSLGVFDVVAANKASVRFIQVKSNRDAPPQERETIANTEVPRWCTKEIWIFHDYQRKPVIHEL